MNIDNKKSKKEKRDVNIAYQNINSSKTSLDSSAALPNTTTERNSAIFTEALNTPVNLKKSKTFKLIVKKGGKDKDKVSFGKKDKFKSKNKSKKRKEILNESGDLDKVKEFETKRPLFGVPLKVVCKHSKSHDGYPIPAFFRICINYLEKENRLSFEGIYRIPGVNSQISKLKQALHLDCVDINNLLTGYDIAVISSTIKSFLRDLPTNIVEKSVEKKMFMAWERNKDNLQDRIEAIKLVVSRDMEPENRYILSFVINHMTKVIELSYLNKMSLENLLIVLCPAIKLHFEMVKFLYDHNSVIFQQYQIPIYIPPIKPGPQHEEELPETLEGIQEELVKQTSYLDDLHSQITEETGTDQTENLIWEVQLIVTSLKRKKYIAELTDPDQIKVEIKKYERQLEKVHKEMLDDTPNIQNNSVNVNSSVVNNVGNLGARNSIGSVGDVCSNSRSIVDQEMWHIQRTLTTLNRKLKSIVVRSANSEIDSNITRADYSNHDTEYTPETNLDDDCDSVQLNLTLRKLPSNSVDSFDESEATETAVNYPTTEINNSRKSPKPNYLSTIDSDNIEPTNQSQTESPQHSLSISSSGMDQTCGNASTQLFAVTSSDTATLADDDDDDDDAISIQQCNLEETEDDQAPDEDVVSNSMESFRTGSNLAATAANIEELIQTGEMWTNDKELLLVQHPAGEDEDLRNEALRLLFTREELISIRNDLKTRMSSESNEINRLARNIEELEDAKTEKAFLATHQYRQLDDQFNVTEDDDQDNLDASVVTSSRALEDNNCHHNSSSDSDNNDSSEEDDEDDEAEELVKGQRRVDYNLLEMQHEIQLDNQRLEQDNEDLLQEIQIERDKCLELKVTLKTQMSSSSAVGGLYLAGNCRSSPWPLSCSDR